MCVSTQCTKTPLLLKLLSLAWTSSLGMHCQNTLVFISQVKPGVHSVGPAQTSPPHCEYGSAMTASNSAFVLSFGKDIGTPITVFPDSSHMPVFHAVFLNDALKPRPAPLTAKSNASHLSFERLVQGMPPHQTQDWPSICKPASVSLPEPSLLETQAASSWRERQPAGAASRHVSSSSACSGSCLCLSGLQLATVKEAFETNEWKAPFFSPCIT
mmetsp:Transcript_102111/g.312297  ORF Transcript_102111/g.312297 Transcript_102111/m.312297 type:complete len:214 (+) Transcript_102111:265-906(+)